MSIDNIITDLLTAPLGPEWTVEELAEQLLSTLAAGHSDELHELVLDAKTSAHAQASRLMRPLLACLATKSATEGATVTQLYGGNLSFQRPGPDGPVWIVGQFENRPGSVRVTLRRSASPAADSRSTTEHSPPQASANALAGTAEFGMPTDRDGHL